MPLRMGVMGCANIAWRSMIPAMLNCPEVELVGVASRSEAKARKFAEIFHCEPIIGYLSLLERDDIQAIYMPLPTGLHEEWVLKALESGKHILVEKTFSMDLASAEVMVALAREKKLLIVENFLFPNHSQHSWVQSLLERKELGEIHLFRSTFGFPPLNRENFRYDRQLGGGALLDTGAYTVKAARLFLGDELEIVGSILNLDRESGVDIYGEAMVRNEEGQVAQLAFGFNYFYQCNYEILGSKGKLVVPRAFTPKPGFQPTVYLEKQGVKEEYTLPADDHFINMFRSFSETVKNGGDYQTEGDELLNQARLLDNIREAAKK